jgi:hypothetical protein
MVRNCQDDVYISDNPVVMHNPRTFGPYGNIGIAVPGIEIYFPLSPEVVLAYFCPSSMKHVEEEQAQAEKEASTFFTTQYFLLRAFLDQKFTISTKCGPKSDAARITTVC